MFCDIVKNLEELKRGIVAGVLATRMVFNQFFNTKNKECVVSVKLRTLRQKRTTSARMGLEAEAQRSNKTTIWFLATQNGPTVLDPEQTFQQNFAQLFMINSNLEGRMVFSAYLKNIPQLSARSEKSCEMPITAAEVQDGMIVSR